MVFAFELRSLAEVIVSTKLILPCCPNKMFLKISVSQELLENASFHLDRLR